MIDIVELKKIINIYIIIYLIGPEENKPNSASKAERVVVNCKI